MKIGQKQLWINDLDSCIFLQWLLRRPLANIYMSGENCWTVQKINLLTFDWFSFKFWLNKFKKLQFFIINWVVEMVFFFFKVFSLKYTIFTRMYSRANRDHRKEMYFSFNVIVFFPINSSHSTDRRKIIRWEILWRRISAIHIIRDTIGVGGQQSVTWTFCVFLKHEYNAFWSEK